MKQYLPQRILGLAGLLLLTAGFTEAFSAEAAGPPARTALRKMMQDGNFKDAYNGMRKWTLSAAVDPRQVGPVMGEAISCLQRLVRVDEIDAYREAVIERHADNWRLLAAAARSYGEVEHRGTMIAGQFHRGPHRGGGKVASAEARDRVRALQLFVRAVPLAADDPARSEVSQLFLQFAQALLYNRGWQAAWRLQTLTDLNELPDYHDGWGQDGWGQC